MWFLTFRATLLLRFVRSGRSQRPRRKSCALHSLHASRCVRPTLVKQESAQSRARTSWVSANAGWWAKNRKPDYYYLPLSYFKREIKASANLLKPRIDCTSVRCIKMTFHSTSNYWKVCTGTLLRARRQTRHSLIGSLKLNVVQVDCYITGHCTKCYYWHVRPFPQFF
jgi:hypothetical protein